MVGVPDWESGVGFEGLRGFGWECFVDGEVGRGVEAEGLVEGGERTDGDGGDG